VYPNSFWCLEPGLNRHAPFLEAADFKSAVSTNFTIEAQSHCGTKQGAVLPWDGPATKEQPRQLHWRGCVIVGGATRSRTELNGFAIRCITALLSRRNHKRKGSLKLPFLQTGAGKESRTLDLNLGKVALYQLSYARISSLEL
jgi:hypothetical protein